VLFHATIRAAALLVGLLLLLGGLGSLALGDGAAAGGIWAIVFGGVLTVAALVQRSRYRSEEAESTKAEPGPGGGEPGYLEPRFLPTTEVFRDPTTGRLMRVYTDPRTGQRRYRAEG
jgi:hypothetical protein